MWTSTTPTALAAAVAAAGTTVPRRPGAAEKWDVFLSHSYADRACVPQVKTLIAGHGHTAYVDWLDDTALDRSRVDRATADTLKQRLQNCRSLIFVVSDRSGSSAWMPWELGYFDGYSGNVAIFPVSERADAHFPGQEYLELYPLLGPATLPAFLERVAGRHAPRLLNPERARAAGATLEVVPQMLLTDPFAFYREWTQYWLEAFGALAKQQHRDRR